MAKIYNKREWAEQATSYDDQMWMGAIKLNIDHEDGEYNASDDLYEFTDGSLSDTEVDGKTIKRIINKDNASILLFGIVTNPNNWDISIWKERYYDTYTTEKTPVYLYFQETDYIERTHYDAVEISPLFVLDGVYCKNTCQVPVSKYTYEKHIITDKEAEEENDIFYTDDFGNKFTVLNKQYEYADGQYLNKEVTNKEYTYKEHVLFRLPTRKIQIYKRLNTFIDELQKNIQNKYIIEYYDTVEQKKRIKIHSESYLSFQKNIADYKINMVKCLPYLYVYNHFHNLQAFRVHTFDIGSVASTLATGLGVILYYTIGWFMSKKKRNKMINAMSMPAFGLGQRRNYPSKYDDKTKTFHKNWPSLVGFYHRYDKYQNLYFKKTYQYQLKEWDSMENPALVDSTYKVNNPKLRRRLSKRYTDKDNKFYYPALFKWDKSEYEKNETDFDSYIGNKLQKIKMNYCYTTRFSFMIYLNKTIRKTKLLAKMGYKYLDYWYKIYNGQYGQTLEFYLYPPDRIQYSEKGALIRFVKLQYDPEVEGGKAAYYVEYDYDLNTFTFYNRGRKEKIVFYIVPYMPKYKDYYLSGVRTIYNNINERTILNYLNNGNTEFMDITTTDIIPRKITLKFKDNIEENEKIINGQIKLENPYYGTSLYINVALKDGTKSQIKADFNDRLETYQVFYTPHDDDMKDLLFNENMYDRLYSELTNTPRNILTYLQNYFNAKDDKYIEYIYQLLFGKEKLINAEQNIFNISNNDEKNFISLNEVIEMFKKEENPLNVDSYETDQSLMSVLDESDEQCYRLALPQSNKDNWVSYNTKYPSQNNRQLPPYGLSYHTLRSDGNVDVEAYIRNYGYTSDQVVLTLEHVGVLKRYKTNEKYLKYELDINFISSQINRYLNNNYISDNFISKEELITKLSLINEIVSYLFVNYLPHNTILSIADWREYFITGKKDSRLKEVFNDYEIYHMGWYNYLISNNQETFDTSVGILLSTIINQDIRFIKKMDLKNNIFEASMPLLPVPTKFWYRLPYYCKKFICEIYSIQESTTIQGGALYANKISGIWQAASVYINMIIMFIISLVVSIFSLGMLAPVMFALMVIAIVLMCIAFLLNLIAMMLPEPASSKLSKAATIVGIVSAVIGFVAAIGGAVSGAAQAVSTMQIANWCVQAVAIVMKVVESYHKLYYEKKLNTVKENYLKKVDEYNDALQEYTNFIIENEFEGDLNLYHPISIEHKANTAFENVLNDSFDGQLEIPYSLYTNLDDYYDTRLE